MSSNYAASNDNLRILTRHHLEVCSSYSLYQSDNSGPGDVAQPEAEEEVNSPPRRRPREQQEQHEQGGDEQGAAKPAAAVAAPTAVGRMQQQAAAAGGVLPAAAPTQLEPSGGSSRPPRLTRVAPQHPGSVAGGMTIPVQQVEATAMDDGGEQQATGDGLEHSRGGAGGIAATQAQSQHAALAECDGEEPQAACAPAGSGHLAATGPAPRWAVRNVSGRGVAGG